MEQTCIISAHQIVKKPTHVYSLHCITNSNIANPQIQHIRKHFLVIYFTNERNESSTDTMKACPLANGADSFPTIVLSLWSSTMNETLVS